MKARIFKNARKSRQEKSTEKSKLANCENRRVHAFGSDDEFRGRSRPFLNRSRRFLWLDILKSDQRVGKTASPDQRINFQEDNDGFCFAGREWKTSMAFMPSRERAWMKNKYTIHARWNCNQKIRPVSIIRKSKKHEWLGLDGLGDRDDYRASSQ